MACARPVAFPKFRRFGMCESGECLMLRHFVSPLVVVPLEYYNLSAMVDFPQSTPLSIAFASLGGAIEVLATAILAYKDANERELGVLWKRHAAVGAIAANVTLQVTSSMLGNLVATWFGPVSLVGPVFLGVQLLANMLVFGYWLGLESFNKDMKVGTFVVVIGVVLLPILGPAAQEDQEIETILLGEWYAIIWSMVLVLGMFVSAVLLLVLKVSQLREMGRVGLLLLARSTAFSVNLTVSKLMVLDISTATLMVAIGLKIASGLIITYALIVQASAVRQNMFTPLNASALIFVNAITGFIIWEDYKVVKDWVGYTCIFVQLTLGNYLLMGDIPMLTPENPRYGRLSQVHMMVTDSMTVESDAWGIINSELVRPEGTRTYESMPATGPGARRPSLSPRKAWADVYGIDVDAPEFATGVHRRQSIFSIDDEALPTEPAISDMAYQRAET